MPNNSLDELRQKVLHTITSAYQDMRGVMQGKKDYRLRDNELTDYIMEEVKPVIAEAERSLLQELARAGNEFGVKHGSPEAGYAHIRDLIQNRLAALQTKEGGSDE